MCDFYACVLAWFSAIYQLCDWISQQMFYIIINTNILFVSNIVFEDEKLKTIREQDNDVYNIGWLNTYDFVFVYPIFLHANNCPILSCIGCKYILFIYNFLRKLILNYEHIHTYIYIYILITCGDMYVKNITPKFLVRTNDFLRMGNWKSICNTSNGVLLINGLSLVIRQWLRQFINVINSICLLQ